MSRLLSLVAKFSRPTTLRNLRPVFISSFADTLDSDLSDSRKLVKDTLKERGFPNNLCDSANIFGKEDSKLLKVSLQPAPEYEVIPDCIVEDIPKKYFLPELSLIDLRLDFKSLIKIYDAHVALFIRHLKRAKRLGTNADANEAVVDEFLSYILFQIMGLNTPPMYLRPFPPCELFILKEPYIIARPDYVIGKNNILDYSWTNRSLTISKGLGEAQIAAEMIAVGDENNRQNGVISDQTIFAIRTIFWYFTFYKAVIPKAYWNELEYGLPKKQSVVIKRWPEDASPEAGLNIAEPNEREKVLTAFSRIRQQLLQ